MEVVLLWLDELDDLVYVAAAQAHRLRWLGLALGACAAGVLPLRALEAWEGLVVLGGGCVAAGGVSLWLLSGLVGRHGLAAA